MGLLVSWFSPGCQQRTTWSLYCHSPHWGGEEDWKKKTKLMGQGKGSLTEQQRKRTVTTILIRTKYESNRMHRATLSHHPMPSVVLSHDSPPLGHVPPLEPSMTSHGIEYLVCLASVGQPARLCPFLAS